MIWKGPPRELRGCRGAAGPPEHTLATTRVTKYDTETKLPHEPRTALTWGDKEWGGAIGLGVALDSWSGMEKGWAVALSGGCHRVARAWAAVRRSGPGHWAVWAEGGGDPELRGGRMPKKGRPWVTKGCPWVVQDG